MSNVKDNYLPKERPMSIIYKNGVSLCLFGIIGETHIDKRRSWIQKMLTRYETLPNDQIVPKFIKYNTMSEYWYYYTVLGSRYNNIPDRLYKEWDKDKIVVKFDNSSNAKLPHTHTRTSTPTPTPTPTKEYKPSYNNGTHTNRYTNINNGSSKYIKK